jgi:two-component system, NarL family, response regulator
MRSSQVTVLCVDDHNLVRDCVVAVLEQDPGLRVVAEARTVRGGLEGFTRTRPDVTLVSLQTRGFDGLQAIRAIRRVDPGARIVVYATDETEAVYLALDAGAIAFVLKDTDAAHLRRVIADASGQNGVQDDLKQTVEARSRPSLTSREVEILELMTQGLRTTAIGATLRISDHTVKAHMKSLYAKLDVHGRAEALAQAIRRGFVRLAADRPVLRVTHRRVTQAAPKRFRPRPQASLGRSLLRA